MTELLRLNNRSIQVDRILKIPARKIRPTKGRNYNFVVHLFFLFIRNGVNRQRMEPFTRDRSLFPRRRAAFSLRSSNFESEQRPAREAQRNKMLSISGQYCVEESEKPSSEPDPKCRIRRCRPE